MKIGFVILCRYNSSRLYGKVLKPISDQPAILHTYNRLCQKYSPAQIIIATSDQDSDSPIEDFCSKNNIQYYRGDLENVAQRFLNAAQKLEVDYAFRVNGDNIFIDLEVIEQAYQLAKLNHYDFISNVKNRTFPKGLSVELIKVNHYKKLLAQINQNEKYREHVTLYLYDNEIPSYYFIYNNKYPNAAGIQLALDTAKDLEKIKQLVKQMGDHYPHYNFKQLLDAYEQLER